MLTKQVRLLPGPGKQLDSQPLLVAHEGEEEADSLVRVSQPSQVSWPGLQEDVGSGRRSEEDQQVRELDLQRLWEVYILYIPYLKLADKHIICQKKVQSCNQKFYSDFHL